MADWRKAALDAPLRAALHMLEVQTLHPERIDAAFMAEIRRDLDVTRIETAAGVGFHYNLINRIADAFDFPIPNAEQKKTLASALNLAGKRLRAEPPDPYWSVAEDGRIRPVEVEAGRKRMLTTPGKTEPSMRAKVAAFVAAQWADPSTAAPLPGALAPYCAKLARHAYRIVDEDVDALRAEGWTDEMIVELTVTGAMAAALVGLDAVMAALHGRGIAQAG